MKRDYNNERNSGMVMMLQAVVANTPAAASCESPPNLVVNIGVVEADGIADCKTIMGNGKPPIIVKGKITGGTTTISGFTSQYTSSLLICSPLAKNATIIKPIKLGLPKNMNKLI